VKFVVIVLAGWVALSHGGVVFEVGEGEKDGDWGVYFSRAWLNL